MEKDKEDVYVFDVCGTLYHVNTTYDFLKYYFKDRDKGKYWFIRLILSMPSKVILVILYKLNIKIDLRSFLIGLLKHEKVHEVEEVAKKFVVKELDSKRFLQTQSILKKAQEENKRVVLVSASLEPVIRAIADDLQVKEYFASGLEIIDEGCYSGKLVGDLKGDKLSVLKSTFDFRNLGFIVHTDNLDDIAIVEAAEKSLVISKKRNLKKWEILLADHKDAEIIHV